jgi:hypothetical protein
MPPWLLCSSRGQAFPTRSDRRGRRSEAPGNCFDESPTQLIGGTCPACAGPTRAIRLRIQAQRKGGDAFYRRLSPHTFARASAPGALNGLCRIWGLPRLPRRRKGRIAAVPPGVCRATPNNPASRARSRKPHCSSTTTAGAFPRARLPRTHILKPPTGHFDGHAENEHVCLALAGSLGMPAVDSRVARFGEEIADRRPKLRSRAPRE